MTKRDVKRSINENEDMNENDIDEIINQTMNLVEKYNLNFNEICLVMHVLIYYRSNLNNNV